MTSEVRFIGNNSIVLMGFDQDHLGAMANGWRPSVKAYAQCPVVDAAGAAQPRELRGDRACHYSRARKRSS